MNINTIKKIKFLDKLAINIANSDLISLAADSDEENKNQLLKLEKINWENQKKIDAIEKTYNSLIDILSALSWLPIPLGNPFSLALAGDAMAKKDYLGAMLCIVGSLPAVGSLGKVVSLARGAPQWVTALLNMANRLGILSVVKPAILWLARTIKDINLRQIITWDVYKKFAAKATGQNASLWFFQKKTSSSLNDNYLFSFAGEEWIPNENFEKAQKELKDLGDKLENMVKTASKGDALPVSAAKPAAGTSSTSKAPDKDLFIEQQSKLIKDRKFKSFTDKDLKNIKENKSKYNLNKDDITAIDTELDDRAVDAELEIDRD